MSDVEIVAAVASTVSGFGAGADLFGRLMEKRREKRHQGQESGAMGLEKSLQQSGGMVQKAYD
jgi:hypothetical protein